MHRNTALYRLLIVALLLALGMVLPLITGQIPAIGQMISPLHIPAYIAGLTCGWGWGLALGLVLPILRSMIFGMPPLVAVAVPMAFELAAYAGICGLCYRLTRRRMPRLAAMLLSLVIAMVCGRMVGGAAKAVVMGLTGSPYTLEMFVSGYFASTAPGALIHLVIIPPVVLALEKAHLSPEA